MTPANLAKIETEFLTHILAAVAARAPYVWGGKGDRIWTPAPPLGKGIIRNPYPVEVFDCAGLITTCLFRAGGPDLRFTHGATRDPDSLRAICPPIDKTPDRARWTSLRLRFYPGHVALHLNSIDQTLEERANPKPILIEAAGGGSKTTAPTPGGYVRRGPERRRDFLSEGSLSAYLATL